MSRYYDRKICHRTLKNMHCYVPTIYEDMVKIILNINLKYENLDHFLMDISLIFHNSHDIYIYIKM